MRSAVVKWFDKTNSIIIIIVDLRYIIAREYQRCRQIVVYSLEPSTKQQTCPKTGGYIRLWPTLISLFISSFPTYIAFDLILIVILILWK